MVRRTNRLNAIAMRVPKARGYYSDGLGLYLQVPRGHTKLDLPLLDQGEDAFEFRQANRMGHQAWSAAAVTLAQAREKATEYRRLLLDGKDPRDTRKAQRQQHQLDAAKAVTFQECAENYIEAHRAEWKNPKHADQWANTLATYAYRYSVRVPFRRSTRIGVGRPETHLGTKHETADRVRQRISKVLGSATSLKLRTGDNPARWTDHLEHHLAKISKEDE